MLCLPGVAVAALQERHGSHHIYQHPSILRCLYRLLLLLLLLLLRLLTPKAMLSRLSKNGVAPISWVDINGSPVAIGSGARFARFM
jgi:hypothetical protein